MDQLDQFVSDADVLEPLDQAVDASQAAPVAPDQRVSSTRRNVTMALALFLSACGSKADKYEGADGVPAVNAVPAVPLVEAVPAVPAVVVSATTEGEK